MAIHRNLTGETIRRQAQKRWNPRVRFGISTICFLLFVSLVLGGCLTITPPEEAPADVAEPRQALFPYDTLTDIDAIDFDEPSGIVFHAQRGTLFVVGDEGDLAEIRPNGALVNKGGYDDADFEGITYHPTSGRLYAITERDAGIVELDPDDLTISRVFTIDPMFDDVAILSPDDNHVEAITFLPDPDLPEGRTFLLTKRVDGPAGQQATSVILEVLVPLQRSGAETTPARIIHTFPLDVADLSGLHYNPAEDRLYLLSDTHNALLEVSRQGDILHVYAFPGRDQEGLTVDPDGFVYFVQDSGGIIKTRWLRQDSP